MVETSDPAHVLIVGGGIIGLTLAQALRKHHPNVRFTVFERDADPTSRGVGWGLTLHWALDTFQALLPGWLVARLDETFVDPVATKAKVGNFLLFEVRSGVERWRVPPSRRIRVKRESLRRLLMTGVDVQWNKTLTSITTTENGVTAHFSDSTSNSGTILLGCDGSRSRVRQHLCPTSYQTTKLPVRLVGVSFPYEKEKAEKMRALDPFFFQGHDTVTDSFLWFSFLETPASTPQVPDRYTCQIIMSWPFRAGFNGNAQPTEVPNDNAARLRLMRSLADSWAEPFKSAVQGLPDNIEAKSINLEDWPPLQGSWDNAGGRITLVGDAAHAMTMYRGEAANHGITDVKELLDRLGPVLSSDSPPPPHALKAAVDAYEDEMIRRNHPAVLASRQACLDAHDHDRIGDSSPLVSRRAVVPDPSPETPTT